MRHLCSTGGRIGRALVILVAGMPAIALAADSWSISIGVRETGTSAAIGDDGGSTGGIEWVNLDGQSIIADGLWHQYTWNFGTDPVTNFSGGNGVLSSATMKGTLENIRILNSGGNVGGAINLRVDNIVNTVGGTPMTVAGFETSEGFTTSLTSSPADVPRADLLQHDAGEHEHGAQLDAGEHDRADGEPVDGGAVVVCAGWLDVALAAPEHGERWGERPAESDDRLHIRQLAVDVAARQRREPERHAGVWRGCVVEPGDGDRLEQGGCAGRRAAGRG